MVQLSYVGFQFSVISSILALVYISGDIVFYSDSYSHPIALFESLVLFISPILHFIGGFTVLSIFKKNYPKHGSANERVFGTK